jgi:hypothetical protein
MQRIYLQKLVSLFEELPAYLAEANIADTAADIFAMLRRIRGFGKVTP